MDHDLDTRRAALYDRLRGLGGAVVAYSGGVDSSYLAAAAHLCLGDRALAVTAASPSLARRDREAATRLARARGWRHRIVETSELEREAYARNAPDRCYWCKNELLEVLGPIARRRGAAVLIGTNLDDLDDIRPGSRAVRETSALTPLADAGLDKAAVRALSRELGLPTAEKPASPCLASRFAYGVRVTKEALRRVEEAEERLRGMGFEVLRVRDHGDLARVEVPLSDIEHAAALAADITRALREAGFRFVTLDLAGFRSGSLNEVLLQPGLGAPSPRA